MKEIRFHSIIYGSTADLSAVCNGGEVCKKYAFTGLQSENEGKHSLSELGGKL